ncbi:uncharacterized protein LOC110851525 [Folsomia candida]|uniref:uncharacterized protein LOC110851525 n=1 Tax=Folsomia candida TaxID=158441 RepID=UPI0016051C27|nr:uncharacterized protein LOC110851525 [Folsomia candida]
MMGMLRSNFLLVQLVVVFVICNSSSCSAWDSPKITLDGFALADSFLTWNTNMSLIPLGAGSNDTVFVVPSSIRGLSLLCNASYPVEWTFHREKWNQRTTWQTVLVNSRGSDPKTLEPLWYSVELRFLGHNVEITGNYTCQKYGQDLPSKSVYIFWEGSSPPYLTMLAAGTHRRTITYNSNTSNTFVIPCTVSRPDIVVQLYKDNQTADLTNSDNVKFNSAVGFTLVNMKNPFGIYKCIVGLPDDEDSLEFEVKSGPGTPTPEFENQLWGTASFTFDAPKRQFVCCSSNKNKPPKIAHFYCSHPITCKLQKHALHKIETASHKSTSENCAFLPLRMLMAGVLRCKGDSIDIVREYFFPMMQPYQRFGQRSNITVTPYSSWAMADPESMMILTNMTDTFYVGETRRFVCRASKFFFSQGIHWTLFYENETINVQGNQTRRSKNHTYGIFQDGNYAIIEIQADIGLKKVVCNAPIWNTTGWAKKTLPFTIAYPTAPILNGSSNDEEITWPTSSKSQLLTCTFSGTPKPRVTWTRNDKVIRVGVRTNDSISYLNVTRFGFPQATFACNVSNVGGYVTKSFKVTISDGLPVWKSIMYVFGAIIICVALVGGSFAFWKVKQQKEAIRRLAQVAFKDVNAVAAATQQPSSVIANVSSDAQGENGNSNGVVHSFPFSEGNTAPEFGRYQKM